MKSFLLLALYAWGAESYYNAIAHSAPWYLGIDSLLNISGLFLFGVIAILAIPDKRKHRKQTNG